ncbi:hypothetical protein D3C80_1599370 [compost metagenome]
MLFRAKQIELIYASYLTLVSALVAGSFALRAAPIDRFTIIFLHGSMVLIVVALAWSSIKSILAHRDVWLGFRRAQHQYGPTHLGERIVPLPDPRKELQTHRFQIAMIAVSAGVIVAANAISAGIAILDKPALESTVEVELRVTPAP